MNFRDYTYANIDGIVYYTPKLSGNSLSFLGYKPEYCQDLEAAPVSISRWVGKTSMGHLHNGILLDYRKKENFTFCNSIDGPGEHYAKWNTPVRERQIPRFHLYAESS